MHFIIKTMKMKLKIEKRLVENWVNKYRKRHKQKWKDT